MLIVESTPEPVPLEDREPDSLTREELVELQKLARERGQAEKVCASQT